VKRVVLLAGLVLIALEPSAAARDLPEIRAQGTLRWGGDLQGGEPYVFEDPEHPGAIIGFEVDIVEALSRRLGLKTTFVQTDWSSLIPALERGDFDVIVNGLEETAERRARIRLSVPYFVYGETLTIRKDAAYTRLADLAGQRVGTLNQTVAHDILKASPVEAVLYEGQQEPYFDLVQGRTAAVLLDHVIAERYDCTLEQLRCLPEDVARGHYVVGLAKDATALNGAVDVALAGMARDGELRRILEGWHLWDGRQAELGTSSATPRTAAPRTADPGGEPALPAPTASSAPPRLMASQLQLFLRGAFVTLLVSVASFALALPLGLCAAVLRVYGGRAARLGAAAYVEFFRGTPLLLQLYVLYFGIAEYVRLGPFTAAIVGLGLNYGAYEAEVHRGALLALPRGQAEAARALGLGQLQALRHVLLPQSLRNALPAVTNDFVALLKDSSLVSVVTVVELTKRMTIVAVELRDWVTPGLLCAGLYFLMGFPLARLARRLENRLEHDPHPRPT
jgi:polar amino acid transport system substrate-binding protein